MTERFAIYFAPAPESLLGQLAAQWLGRDATTDKPISAAIAGIEPDIRKNATRSARRYGFHATLKAPMALAPGYDRKSLEAAMGAYAERQAPVDIGPLVLFQIGGFLALVPEAQPAALTAFTGDLVTHFDIFRAPLSTAARNQRLGSELNGRQIELLDTYGYPYVMEEFQFHMTISDKLDALLLEMIEPAARAWFAPVTGGHLVLDRLVLFHETEGGAAFRRIADFPLRGR